MKKKNLSFILVFIIASIFGIHAENIHKKIETDSIKNKPCYIDENNNEKCDRYEKRRCNKKCDGNNKETITNKKSAMQSKKTTS